MTDDAAAPERSGAAGDSGLAARPASTLRLWPHQSLPPRGFVAFVGATAALIALPLLVAVGSAVLWVLLPFAAVTVWLLWAALRRNARDRAVVEHLRLSPDRISLTRHDGSGQDRTWEANPHWVRLELHRAGGPVPDYLTLGGNGRTVEIGAFLTPEERRDLHGDLTARLQRLRGPA